MPLAKKKKKKAWFFNFLGFFLTEVLAERAAGDGASKPSWRWLTEREIGRGGRQAGEFLHWGFLNLPWKKASSYWLQGRPERQRERERAGRYSPPRSINHTLLCNFTLAKHTQTHKGGVGTLVKRRCEEVLEGNKRKSFSLVSSFPNEEL